MQDKYDITKILTRDSAGGLYEAVDIETEKTVICRRFFDQEGESNIYMWKKTFEKFTDNISRIDHPNYGKIITSGIDRDGAYIVYPDLGGITLQEVFDKETTPYNEVLVIIKDMLSVFSAIHSKNLVHGNLLPKSITKTINEKGENTYILTDMGLAELLPHIQESLVDIRLPALISPEGIRGDMITAQSDLFMLGQLIYTLIADGHPYGNTSLEEAYEVHAQQSLPQIHTVNASVPESFSVWLQRMIAYQPELRFQSAQEASDALSNLDAFHAQHIELIKQQAKDAIKPFREQHTDRGNLMQYGGFSSAPEKYIPKGNSNILGKISGWLSSKNKG